MKRSLKVLLASLLALGLTWAAPAQADEPPKHAANYDFVSLETSHGKIVLLLDKKRAPISAANFKQYVTDGFYDGTIFHRIIPTFVIQGGGFDAEMNQKPTRKPIKNEWRNGMKNIRGSLSMARTAVHDSATSQFFINTVDNPFLSDVNRPRTDGACYAVFGSVIEGLDVVDKIKAVPTGRGPNGMPDVPQEPRPGITKATMIEWKDLSDSARAAVQTWETKANEWTEAVKAKQEQLEARAKEIKLEFSDVTAGLESAQAQRSESGILFYDAVVGEGPKPEETQTVRYAITGWTPSGGVWWRTEDEQDKSQTIPVRVISRFFRGLQQTVLEMNVGSTRYVRVPAELAFGDRGLKAEYWLYDDVAPGSDVIAKVTLLEITEKMELGQDGVQLGDRNQPR